LAASRLARSLSAAFHSLSSRALRNCCSVLFIARLFPMRSYCFRSLIKRKGTERQRVSVRVFGYSGKLRAILGVYCLLTTRYKVVLRYLGGVRQGRGLERGLTPDRLRAIFRGFAPPSQAPASKLRTQFVERRFFICPRANHYSIKKPTQGGLFY